ncbi:Hypothetical predicted protein [Mytilus galloprovincialis]|uniref:Uncharacterized protein n=1 Tax=Mytilus galloprovincialis TaxID=29158 RepID=A0A8B6G1V6_MYTGA|nr:Hypothetical predicted protein [Mytilus galloprovincialis]
MENVLIHLFVVNFLPNVHSALSEVSITLSFFYVTLICCSIRKGNLIQMSFENHCLTLCEVEVYGRKTSGIAIDRRLTIWQRRKMPVVLKDAAIELLPPGKDNFGFGVVSGRTLAEQQKKATGQPVSTC